MPKHDMNPVLCSSIENRSQLRVASFLMITTMLTGAALIPAGARAADATTQQMPTVTVEGSRESEGYTATEPPLYKLTAPLLETPQSITVLPRELLDDQGATTMRDALRNVPGISIAAGEGGAQGDNLTIRGFTARSDFFLDGMRDFGSYYRDPFNLENIAVLKGPDSILFGRGSTGGVVNQVSKQPELYDFNEGALAFGTDLTKRATADINQKIGEHAALRVNVMGNDGDVAGRDGAHNSRYGFAPSLALGIGTETRVNFDYFHQSENNIPDYGLPWFYTKPAPVSRDNFYGFQEDNEDFLKTNVDVGTARIEHDFNNNLSLRNQLRYAHYDRNVRITEPAVRTGTLPTDPLASIVVTRKQLVADSTETFLSNQTDLTSKFATGNFHHTLVSGIELSRETSNPTRFTYSGVPSTNLVTPNEHQPFSGTATISSLADATADTAAAYFVDTMAINPQWDIIGGLRYDYVDSEYTQTVAPTLVDVSRIDKMLSWRGGIVYKPVSNGSVYFDAGTSFNPSIEGLSVSAANTDLAPEKSLTFELGTKWELLDKKLTTTFAVFRDDKTNARTPDPTDSLVNVLTGQQRVDGFEWGATGHLTDKWQIFTGYAFLHSEVVESNNPLEEGNPVANAPRHSFTLWSTYELPNKITVGGGAKAISSRLASITPNSTTHVLETAPGYVTFDAMAKYPVTGNVDLQLNLYNLADRYYFDQIHPAHVIPGPGRTALLTTSFKF